MKPLGQDEIHIHLLWVDENQPGANTAWLDAAERQRAHAFHRLQDQKLYTAAHVFLRQVLSYYADIPPADWQFHTQTFGKPMIANSAYRWLQFNLSHTTGLVACAVTREQVIGVDVEQSKPIADLADLTAYAFSPTEASDVLNLSAKEQQARFFSYWTLKEAYLKAAGQGLQLPLQSFAFVQDNQGYWHWQGRKETFQYGQHWQANTCQLPRDYYLAYCVQTACLANQVLTVWVTDSNSCTKLCWNDALLITPISC